MIVATLLPISSFVLQQGRNGVPIKFVDRRIFVMTKNEARERLAATWRFSRVGENIVLREVALIEAVRDHERTTSTTPPLPQTFAGSPRPS